MDSPDVVGGITLVTWIGTPNKKKTHLALYHIYDRHVCLFGVLYNKYISTLTK